MSTPVRDKVEIKLFVGFEFIMDIKVQLNQLIEWKQSSITKSDSVKRLQISRFNDVEYIGVYLDGDLLTIKDLRKEAELVKADLLSFLPELDTDNLNINLFPQAFVS